MSRLESLSTAEALALVGDPHRAMRLVAEGKMIINESGASRILTDPPSRDETVRRTYSEVTRTRGAPVATPSHAPKPETRDASTSTDDDWVLVASPVTCTSP